MAGKPAPMNRAQMRLCVQRWRPHEAAQCLSLVKTARSGVFKGSCHIRYSIHKGGGTRKRLFFCVCHPHTSPCEKKKRSFFKDREKKMLQERNKGIL